MSLEAGYAPTVITSNITELISSGRSAGTAHAIAYRRARKAYKAMHPGSPLPEYLERRQRGSRAAHAILRPRAA